MIRAKAVRSKNSPYKSLAERFRKGKWGDNIQDEDQPTEQGEPEEITTTK